MSDGIGDAKLLRQPLALDLTPDEVAAGWPMETGFALLETTLPGANSWSIVTAFPTHGLIEQLPDWRPGSEACRETTEEEESPFRTGWIGYLAYESAPLWNPMLTTRYPHPRLPVAWWGRYDASLSYRHADRSWTLHCIDNPESRSAADRLLATLEAIQGPGRAPIRETSRSSQLSAPGFELGVDRSEYDQAIGTVLDWIGQGHIYQANYTYPVTAPLLEEPYSIYRRLRMTNPAPYGAFLQASTQLAILSSSPEQFLRVDGRRIRTQPIKGTEARHPDPALDRKLADTLRESPKDRAELTMIVDLERNDLGRICEYGSVITRPFPIVESFASVHHLLANVEGQLREGVRFADILAATFPGGSVTGAPKIRAMEIIAELERRPRFIYTGALGYLDDRGKAELALTIRTLWTDGRQIHFDVGGGIVADSTADSEWEETHQKAEGMRRAVEGLGMASETGPHS